MKANPTFLFDTRSSDYIMAMSGKISATKTGRIPILKNDDSLLTSGLFSKILLKTRSFFKGITVGQCVDNTNYNLLIIN